MIPDLDLSVRWQLATEPPYDMGQLVQILMAIEKVGNLAAAAKICRLSYRHAWGMIRDGEKHLKTTLVQTVRGQGSVLTELAQQIVILYRRHEQLLHPHVQGVAQQLNAQLQELYAQQRHILRLHASHGFAVEGLMRWQSDHPSGFRMALQYRTGGEALALLQKKECDVAGFQLPTGKYQDAMLRLYQDYLQSEPLLFVLLACRRVGLFVQPHNPLQIQGMADLVRPEVRVVNRQPGSGTRYLMRWLLEDAGVDADLVLNYGATEFTHMAVAAHVASGMADVGFGIETAARRCGLEFISLEQERYFFAFHQDMVNSAIIQSFLSVLRSPDYKHYMQQLAGYESEHMGTIYTLEQLLQQDLSVSL